MNRLTIIRSFGYKAACSGAPARGVAGSAKIAAFIAVFLLLVSGLQAAGKISRDLAGLQPGSKVDVIVQFTQPPSAADLADLANRGATARASFPHINGVLLTVPAAALNTLASNPNIKYISPDRTVQGALEFAEPTVNANIALQYGWNGAGVGVAVIDSGIYNHPDLYNRIVYAESFLSDESGTGDGYGHGTHVAGIIGGSGAMSTSGNAIYTFRGIAPQANLINLRVLDSKGQGTDSGVIAAVERAIALKAKYGIRILNLSLGRTIQESYALDPLCQELEKAWQAGLTVVVAAGNNGRDNSMGTSGYSTITAPGNDPYVITVGAMKDMGTVSRGDDLIASYSSKGPTLLDQVVKPDIVAPGNRIVSDLQPWSTIVNLFPTGALPVSYYKYTGSTNSSQYYFRLSGTSMATPMVSGAAALLLQQNPSLTPDQIKARLMKTATKAFPSTSSVTDPSTGNTYVSTYDIFTVGAGYLDVWAALNSTDIASGSAVSPVASFDPSTGITSIKPAPNSTWSAMDTTVVWGSNVVTANDTTVVWGSAVIWGSSTSNALTVIWGSTVVWGSSSAFGGELVTNGE